MYKELFAIFLNLCGILIILFVVVVVLLVGFWYIWKTLYACARVQVKMYIWKKLNQTFTWSLSVCLLGAHPGEFFLVSFFCLFVCFFNLPSELVFNSDVLLKVTSLFQDKKRNSTINSRTLVSSPSGASFYGYFVAKKKKMPFFWFWDLKCELVAKLYNRPRLQAV